MFASIQKLPDYLRQAGFGVLRVTTASVIDHRETCLGINVHYLGLIGVNAHQALSTQFLVDDGYIEPLVSLIPR
jgi:hypothetical protein